MNKHFYKGIKEDTSSRIIYVTDPNKFDITKVNKGILSFHANWSGHSIIHGNSILKLIDRSEVKDFYIYVFDIDLILQEKQLELIAAKCHGYFESVWVENGKIEFNYRDTNRAQELAKFIEFLNEKLKITSSSEDKLKKEKNSSSKAPIPNQKDHVELKEVETSNDNLVTSYEKEFFTIFEYYEQGLLTKKELFSQVVYLNQMFYIEQGNLQTKNYFIGGTAKDLTKE
ncbi:hypothetical protein [Aquimarina algiphila]|uniref:Uncharacterized protein n=1 Tax=Aquimarina algiphila TaxID=2047982 RepID=A0A554VEU1_9FLAO|nr:hypothetical protein [Aquimarina algiphila]TSE05590.1 hypothetical protein FOF46_22345 [Aquimarina algiphila]